MQPPTTIHNHPKNHPPSTITHNHPQPPKKPPTTTQKLPKKAKTCHIWLSWLFVFVSIKSNSFDGNSHDFCLLKVWIYDLLLINIKQRSVQQSTISAHELPYEFLRILSIFRGKFYCLSLATVAVDINVKTLKRMEFCCHNLLRML